MSPARHGHILAWNTWFTVRSTGSLCEFKENQPRTDATMVREKNKANPSATRKPNLTRKKEAEELTSARDCQHNPGRNQAGRSRTNGVEGFLGASE